VTARSRSDWSGVEPAAIPTKTEVPQLARWVERSVSAGARVVDVGCGAGIVASRLVARGLEVVGLDINAAAIEQCRRSVPAARFCERDVASENGLELAEAPFDFAVCQLVASVVGDAADRQRLARNIHEVLAPGGGLFISFSGLSGDVNSEYAELYARDESITQTYGTYWSRDAGGRPLYCTHHFARDEVAALLTDAGFVDVAIEEVIEVSSRRPDQRARFYYATARRR
jgi:SAM-dependent methyltransferase